MNITFGGLALPGTLTGLQRPVVARPRVGEVVRGGSYSQGGLIAAKRIVINGLIKGPVSIAQQTAALDDLKSRAPTGVIAPLRIEAGRSYLAEVDSITETINGRRFAVEYEATFLVPAGTAIGDAPLSQSFSSNGVFNLSQGNMRAYPIVRVNFSSVSASATVTISNTTTGEALTFAPTTNATRYLDSDLEKIYLLGGTNRTEEWVSGDFPTLTPGNNALTFSWANCAVSSIVFDALPRWT